MSEHVSEQELRSAMTVKDYVALANIVLERLPQQGPTRSKLKPSTLATKLKHMCVEQRRLDECDLSDTIYFTAPTFPGGAAARALAAHDITIPQDFMDLYNSNYNPATPDPITAPITAPIITGSVAGSITAPVPITAPACSAHDDDADMADGDATEGGDLEEDDDGSQKGQSSTRAYDFGADEPEDDDDEEEEHEDDDGKQGRQYTKVYDSDADKDEDEEDEDDDEDERT